MSPITATTDRLEEAVGIWAQEAGVPPSWLPSAEALAAFGGPCALRPSAKPGAADDWERRHGFALPPGLRAWLRLSDGFYLDSGPAVHPLGAIGPMVPFARVPGLIVQPESWFELGNPNEAETICIDLAYDWQPGGGGPIFASGDDQTGLPPRIIAPSFEAWFARLLREGGRAYWLDPDFAGLGDPWAEHRRRSPAPPLPDRLRRLLPRVALPADDSSLAASLGISRFDAEAMLRHLQHAPLGEAPR